MLVAGFSTRPSSPWRSFPSTFPLVFLPLIRDGRHCGWHGAPRFLSLTRCRRVGWTLLLDHRLVRFFFGWCLCVGGVFCCLLFGLARWPICAIVLSIDDYFSITPWLPLLLQRAQLCPKKKRTLLLDLWQSPCWLRSFLLLVFHPALLFLSLALRYWLTLLLHSPLFHIHIVQIFYFSVQSALYAASRGLFPNSLLPVPIPANLKFVATPEDRSLVMRAVGGAITSPCSNDPESRRPTPTIIWLSPHLLFICWMILGSPIQITALSGRLLVLFCVYTWLVQLKRAFWRGRFRVGPAEPVYVPTIRTPKLGVKQNHFWPLGSVKQNLFWPRIWPKLHPTSKNGDKSTVRPAARMWPKLSPTSKNGDEATLALPVSSLQKLFANVCQTVVICVLPGKNIFF